MDDVRLGDGVTDNDTVPGCIAGFVDCITPAEFTFDDDNDDEDSNDDEALDNNEVVRFICS